MASTIARGTADAPLAIQNGPTERILASAVSSDGAHAAASSDDKTLRVWRTSDWAPVATLCVRAAAHGRTVVVGLR